MNTSKKLFPAKIRIEGKIVHIGDFPTAIEASLARSAAGTLWNQIKPYVVFFDKWETE
jgi:hypothetical protein